MRALQLVGITFLAKFEAEKNQLWTSFPTSMLRVSNSLLATVCLFLHNLHKLLIRNSLHQEVVSFLISWPGHISKSRETSIIKEELLRITLLAGKFAVV